MAESTMSSAKKATNSNTVPIIDVVYRTLHYWPWLLFSLFICVGVATLYLLYTPKIYTTSASLLIKDNSQPENVQGAVSEFSNMGLFQNKTNIQNEMTTLMSSDLMREVVIRLKLDYNYYTHGTFHKKIAYGNSLPIRIEMPDFSKWSTATFDLNVDEKKRVVIENLKINDDVKCDEVFKGVLNDTILTAAGPIIVIPTDAFDAETAVDLIVEKIPTPWAVGYYSGNLMVSLNNKEGTVIDLTITDQSTKRSQDVLNTLIEVYNENWISDKNQIAISTSNFITERLGVIEGELGNVDANISTYKSEHLIPDVDAASAMYMTESQKLSQEILQLRNQLQMARYIRDYLSNDRFRKEVLPGTSGIGNVEIESQIKEYNDLILQRNNLVAHSSEKNPLVISIDEQLHALRGAMIASVDNTIHGLNTQVSNLSRSQASTTTKIASNPTQAKYLLSVERQQKVKEALYLFLLQKREENELSQAFTAYNTRIIKKPYSWGPTAPNSKKIILASIFLGLAIPFGIVFLKESNNTKVRGRKDIENLTLPFMGEIPNNTPRSHKKDERSSDGKNSFVVQEGKRDIINESFRVLRTNVQFMSNSTSGANIIALTSFNPGSGKSFISVNLGMAIALKGKHVLVIDGDMRHGSASTYVGSPGHGLSDYLSKNDVNLASLIIKNEDATTLDVLPVGTVPPNPTELLESYKFEELLNQLRPKYDYILIDCPPIEVVADAQIINSYVDRTIFIIRAGLLERSMLNDLNKLYEEKKYKNMAIVLNGTRNDQGRYGYSHSYRYGYGYGYGYGYNYGDGKGK